MSPPGPSLNSVRSNPVLLPSRPPGSVKDMANRFDRGATAMSNAQPALTINTARDRYKRPTNPGRTAQRSPTSENRKLQKRPPGTRSPRKSPSTSFELSNSSFSSNTSAGTMKTTRSQPHAAFSPKRAKSPSKQLHVNSRPLFGEITADGKWNGNFDVDLGNYGPLPTFEKAPRRGSEGSLALGHGRSQSHQDISTPLLAPPSKHKLSHKRSRSDMDTIQSMAMPSMPNLGAQAIPALYPTPPDSVNRPSRHRNSPSASRIPVSNRRPSDTSTASSNGQSRAASAMSNPPDRRRLAKSPTRPSTANPANGKENAPSASRSRYHPPTLPPAQPGQTLSAKIVAPLPKTSPPLRSSRPRQPVSSATTSASRARAAERFQGANTRDGRRPSEQWLGKPYDPQKERSRRRIPELDQINFEERRERIQKAITQSLKSSESQESMRRSHSRSRSASSRTPSRLASNDYEQAAAGADVDTRQNVDQQGQHSLQRGHNAEHANGYPQGLSVETTGIPEASPADAEPLTGHTDRTMFEDESPVLGRPAAVPTSNPPEPAAEEPPILLTPATYQPPTKAVPLPSIEVPADAPAEEVQSPSILENVMRMRESSPSSASRTGTEFADDSASAEESPSDLGDRWGLGNSSVGGDQGSIRIMLDDDPSIVHHSEPWSKDVEHSFEEVQHQVHSEDDVLRAQEYNHQAFTSNGYMDSPVDEPESFPEDPSQVTPRKYLSRDDTLKPTTFHEDGESPDAQNTISRVLDYYRSTGSFTPEMIQALDPHVLDLHRLSANGGSDANMIQSLLASVMNARSCEQEDHDKQLLDSSTYEIPSVTPDTPDTPPMDAGFEPGTVIVYGSETHGGGEDDDFEAKIRKADEEWERQQRGEEPIVDDDEEIKPLPPPKDIGYTPRSSTGPNSAVFPPSLNDAGLRISTSGQLDIADIQAAGERAAEFTSPDNHMSAGSAPPLPSHAPPPPPPADSVMKAQFALPDLASAKAYSDRESTEMSPRYRKTNWTASGSSRPSIDSQRVPPQVPASQSMTSFTESTRQTSFDTGADSQTRLVKTTSPGPEQKRLIKRRLIVKELLDTEYSYHQDLKIVEDIYKATCTPELVAPDDKKVLFGNCDEVERFAIQFYDELRKAAAQIYVPARNNRWGGNKRSSFSTTQSDGTSQTYFSEPVDDEKDRSTTIGRTFLTNMQQIEKVYGAYLKNHDAANKRLSAIQSTTTVKCWLDECHANASDITSAWDLDSLLVKPTQRVGKYPLLLKQLLETTPPEHPDFEDLRAAADDSISMLTRINDAKKRADLVDQIVNRKSRKESDVRNGLAKAFGRRTEKLKERVGIAEVFSDPDFDELAHKFGGHFIRLQICMRDVQDYLQKADNAINLINNYANALELFTDVHQSQLPEIESKWRRYGQVIRDLTQIAFNEHKAAVQKRVLAPMIQCIKLHEGPQSAINKRKKRILDYAKFKSDEKRGIKSDKKTVEAAEVYMALNEQLKLDLPKLYNMTAQLVRNCLHVFLDIQLTWHSTWERKLKPLLEAADIPSSIQQIEPAFKPDFIEVEKELHQLSICNGTLKIEAANFLSPQPTSMDTPEPASAGKRRPSTLDSSNRTLSVGSESSTTLASRRHSGIYIPGAEVQSPMDTRYRSNSAMSTRHAAGQTPGSAQSASRPWSNSNTPNLSFSANRPSTGNQSYFQRDSTDQYRNQRPASDATYFTARPDQAESQRYSGVFSSAMPPEIGTPQQPASPSRSAPEDMNVMFVCASLFEFSIDKTRKEAGYPYLQYVQGEVFDVVAQKGELWLAKNQDDASNELGWIWEQHFIILSTE
ncbi:hypothetical protein M409DRAFT_66581 [Zasmidium cellare ATCC 36951]|uniref:DH domain-containing protein n=1 Tax=Zasmidium cellare ATCC 36951 TaxID=1080233 RepID=A0A6A6CKV3_ZASCE|nr:uncharacterized protein M409DRAFT_66581 [Zasmidium cellare ATCC 36951]KAF2166562.1 hypothetical protein M409DRAFT_66581 [Zasmidium cellare ATCC 36951]